MASGVNFGTQQYFGFDPRTIPGCCLWLDAADARTLTTSGGGNVTQWADKSGVGANMTPFGTNSNATIQTNYQNGLSALNFSGLNQYQTPANTGVYPSDVYILVALKSLTRMDVISVGPTNADNFNSLTFAEYQSLRWHNGSSSFARTPATVSSTDETSTSLLIMNWSLANNNFVIRRNGTQLSSTSAYTYGPSAGAVIQIGFRHQNFGTNLAFNAYVGEVVTFDRQLVDAERQQVEGYLAWKWALQANLPSSHPFRPAPPAMRAFLPADVSGGTALWLDAADATTMTLSGTNVTQWRDKSGNGNATTTATGPPTITSSSLNGLSGINLSASPARCFRMQPLTNPANQTTLTAFMVMVTSNSSGGNNRWLSVSKVSDGTANTDYSTVPSFIFCRNGLSQEMIVWRNNSNSGGLPITYNQPFAMSCVFDGTTARPFMNGTAQTTFASSGTFGFDRLAIGQNSGNGGEFCDGLVYEVILYYTDLTTAQRQQVEGYLARKWGLQGSLPTTHPYYRVLPSTPLFSPPQLSGLVLWMDPTDSTTLTLSGSSVIQWRDKSASGATFTTVNANPTYTASLINGLPGLDLTNASAFISSTTQNLTSSLTLAMILVVKSGIGAWGSFFTHGNRDLDFAMERNSISTGTTLQFQTANDNSGANITFTTDQVSLYLGTMTTGTSRFFSRFGGGTTTTATGTNSSTITTGLQTIRIGRSDVGENCNSFIGEIVYYNRVLTTLERQELEGYLAWKWGLQASLPSTHPFAKVRP
jgi:hypothetical protein